MASAVLFVTGSKKFDAAAEKEIKEKLEGKRLTVVLSSAEVDDKRSLTDKAAVEAKVTKTLFKVVPALFMAKKLDFRKSITVAGDVKLLVKTENERPYPCTLQLDGPPAPKATPGLVRMENLVQCEFDAVMNSRALWIEVSYAISHANAGRIIQNCDAALAKLDKELTQRVTELVGGTVLKLNDGLVSTGSKAMDWDAADKLVEQLNRDIQRQIDGVYKEAEARLAAKEGKSVPGGIQVDVVARFDKFKLDKTLSFPGGSAPSVDGKSLKQLGKRVDLINKSFKAFGDVAASVTSFAAQYDKLYAEARKSGAAGAKPAELAETILPDMEKPRKQLAGEVKRLESEVSAAGGHMLELSKAVKVIIKKHAGDAPKSPDAQKSHGKVATHLKNVLDALAQLRKVALDCGKRVDATVALLDKGGALLPSEVEQLGEATDKAVLRTLADAGAKLESTCKKVQAELKD